MLDTRLNNAVLRGEIDNTRRGETHLKFWLFGKEQPVSIALGGDCLRDLAGTHIYFENTPLDRKEPVTIDLDSIEKGEIGEVTASSRLCMHKPNQSGGYNKPVYINALRIEFYCELGRILLEAFNFTSLLINKTWFMTEEENFAQRACNFSVWQGHIESSQKFDLSSDAQDLANLYDEIHQRFADNFDFDQQEAALMGWTGILNALAEISTTPLDFANLEDKLPSDLEEMLLEDLGDDEDWLDEWENESNNIHPLIDTVKELIEDFEVQAANLSFPRGRHYQRLINTLDDIEEGLTGLLNPVMVNAMPANTGLIGCREYLGKMMIAFHHFSRLLEITETKDGRKELLFLRDGLLDLREGISALRFEMNNL